jgi:hypothetical protein
MQRVMRWKDASGSSRTVLSIYSDGPDLGGSMRLFFFKPHVLTRFMTNLSSLPEERGSLRSVACIERAA